MNFKKRKLISSISLLLIISLSVTLSEAHTITPDKQTIEPYIPFGLFGKNREIIDLKINYDKIVDQGFQLFSKQKHKELERWYDDHPLIEFASLIDKTMTLKFIDGSYRLLLDISSAIRNNKNEYLTSSCSLYDTTPLPRFTSEKTNGKAALILNSAEYLYGNRYCQKIMKNLQYIGYNVTYMANEEIDLNFTKNNLNAEIIYMNTHAGYWDIDGDKNPDTVVIATGEKWTNDTQYMYQFEYNSSMIVRGDVGENSFVAFTPALIEYYYQSGDLPDSLIYMATCEATYDDSMAEPFLNAGASVYMGWKRTTVFWTNSITSAFAFKLLCKGLTVKQVCRRIGSGGIYNFLFRSKLTYYGDGCHRITTRKVISLCAE